MHCLKRLKPFSPLVLILVRETVGATIPSSNCSVMSWKEDKKAALISWSAPGRPGALDAICAAILD